MIWLYSGTPGSGKSYHATKDIAKRLSNKKDDGKYVISNYNLNTKSSKFLYLDNSELTPAFLKEFALTFHKIGKENQSLVVIDEAQIKFNCRDFNAKDRRDWIEFLAEHRKYGYNIILICMFDRMLDRQIRGFIEYEVKHRKVNNYGGFGLIFNILHIPLFFTIEVWYGAKTNTSKGFLTYDFRVAKLYNSMRTFS